MIRIEPVGVVRSGRAEIRDDHWSGISQIIVDEKHGEEALAERIAGACPAGHGRPSFLWWHTSDAEAVRMFNRQACYGIQIFSAATISADPGKCSGCLLDV